MTDSEKLRALATWFDIHDAMKGKQLFDNEVQIDLRAMADRIEQLNKHVVMQAGSEKQPYFKLSTNEFGKHWLFYKPLKSEPGKYGCWMPIDDEFYSEFNKLQKAALGSGAAVASEGQGETDMSGVELQPDEVCSCPISITNLSGK